MKVKITAKRNIYAGVDDDGNRVHAGPRDELSVPGDLSKESATKLLKSGFAVAVKETKQTATVAAKETATVAAKAKPVTVTAPKSKTSADTSKGKTDKK